MANARLLQILTDKENKRTFTQPNTHTNAHTYTQHFIKLQVMTVYVPPQNGCVRLM